MSVNDLYGVMSWQDYLGVPAVSYFDAEGWLVVPSDEMTVWVGGVKLRVTLDPPTFTRDQPTRWDGG